jgi:serine/threonine protein kinase
MPALLDCPPLECWQALFADTLPPGERERLERHLETCPHCQERLDQPGEFNQALRRQALRLGDPTLTSADPALTEVVERLLQGGGSSDQVTQAEPGDLYFLRPAGQPDLLGLLGDYQVQEVIGQGGMGIVLKAFEPALNRLVAIKVMSAAIAGSAVARRRFTREAKAAAAVSHDHIVTVHGVHEADGLPYLVMQYVRGESLQARLDRSGPLEVVEIVRIGLQTASGLAAAHAQGLIHRDIKPANLLLENGLARVKITDFGLARMIDEVGLTQSGVVAGTPEYMAPEQARGEPVDHRSDLFSLGCVLYAMCTGLPPFRAGTAVAVLRQVSDHEARPIRSLNPDVPAWLEALVTRLMAKDPTDRLQSAAEVADLLEGYLAHLCQPVTIPAPVFSPLPADAAPTLAEPALPDPGLKGFRSRLWLPGLAALLLLGAGISWWLAQGNAGGDLGGAEWHQKFDGSTELRPGVKLYGIGPSQLVQFDPEGLKVTLPPGYPGQRPATGLTTGFGLRGDFDVTVSIEIVDEERGLDSLDKFLHGVSLEVIPLLPAQRDPEVWIKSGQNKVSLVRNLGRRNRSAFQTRWTRWDGSGETGKEEVGIPGQFFTSAREVRLRLMRTGPDLSCLASGGFEQEFVLLHKDSFGTGDLRSIRVVGTTSGRSSALTFRVKELRIQAQGFSRAPAAIQKPSSEWTRWLLLVPLVIVLPLGVWLCTRLGRTGKDAAAADKPATPAPAAPAVVAFPCSGCGKGLKARAALAGKTAKCRHCGTSVRVPAVVLLVFTCLFLASCSSRNSPSADFPDEPLSPDESVLQALEPYDPVYKIDSTGRVVRIRLDGQRIPASVVDEVSKLTELRLVSLYAASLTDGSLEKLQTLSQLRSLGLGATPITEQGIAHLEPITTLRWLWLPKELVNTPAVDKLKAAIPELTVYPQ